MGALAAAAADAKLRFPVDMICITQTAKLLLAQNDAIACTEDAGAVSY